MLAEGAVNTVVRVEPTPLPGSTVVITWPMRAGSDKNAVAKMTGITPAAMDALCIVNRNDPLRFVEFNQEVDHNNKCNYEAKKNPEDRWVDWKFKPAKEVQGTLRCIKECST